MSDFSKMVLNLSVHVPLMCIINDRDSGGESIKKLILINGTMGVGKTTVSLELQKLLPQNVFLDGDWCWNMNPFIVNDETKTMVMNNISFLLNRFIECNEYKNIIFCWVMYEQSIVDDMIEKLKLHNCKIHIFSLVCTEEALKKRLELDINEKKRTEDILARSLPRLQNYLKINSIKIDVSNITPIQSAKKILSYLEEEGQIGIYH